MAMTWCEEVMYAEPTLVGTAGAVSLQIILWLLISSWEFGFVKRLDRFLRERCPRFYLDVIGANYAKKDDLDLWGVKDMPEVLFVSYVATFLHHGSAGLLMHIGAVTQASWIWRHGLLIQLAGCDVLDFLRIAWCIILPPGPFPTREAMKDRTFPAVIGFHHSVSLLAGLPVIMYFANQPQFQFMGVLLAGYPMSMILFDLVAKSAPPQWTSFNALSDVVVSLGFCYQRIYVYFPLALELLYLTVDAEIPVIAKVSLALGGFCMSMFNLMMLAMSTQNMKKLVRRLREARAGQEVEPAIDCSHDSSREKSSAMVTQDASKANVSGLPTLLRKRQNKEHQVTARCSVKSNDEGERHRDSDTTSRGDSRTQ
eukprot:TRINITY_DN4358_c0_g2_i1.p1 TRINITY_DN4358_c0_g2~~TRINITY_DN4358_c0_g2_i1.p1  ORF type:complete len:392 (-),score=65.46 TRINITY_DN4358_c0_g2_i1:496-1602(-)